MRTADAALACCDVPSGRARGRPRRALSHGNEFVLHRMVVRRSDIPSPCDAADAAADAARTNTSINFPRNGVCDRGSPTSPSDSRPGGPRCDKTSYACGKLLDDDALSLPPIPSRKPY